MQFPPIWGNEANEYQDAYPLQVFPRRSRSDNNGSTNVVLWTISSDGGGEDDQHIPTVPKSNGDTVPTDDERSITRRESQEMMIVKNVQR